MAALKEFFEDIAGVKAPGPAMAFDASHVYFALELVATRKLIGRSSIAKQLEVGEGTIRTIINRLKSEDLIETSRKGTCLTEKGLALWCKFEQLFPKRAEIGNTELANAQHNYAFLVKKSGQNVGSGIEQRDVAVVAGASGAVIVVSKQGHLTIESVSDRVEKRFPLAASQIQSVLNPGDNDVIVLVSAATLPKAKHAAFAASWTLVSREEPI